MVLKLKEDHGCLCSYCMCYSPMMGSCFQLVQEQKHAASSAHNIVISPKKMSEENVLNAISMADLQPA